MSLRVAGWSLGFLGGVALAAVVPEDVFPAVRPVALAGLWLALGLVGEWLHARAIPTAGLRVRDTRAPDGTVDIAVVQGVRRVVNTHDARIGRFVGFEPPDGVRDRLPAPRPAGEVPPLLGRVALVSIFVGHDGRSWGDADVAHVHEALERAGRWLEREALRWGAAVNVEIADTYFLAGPLGDDDVAIGFAFEGTEVVSMERHAERKALGAATRVAVAHGFRDAEHLMRAVERRLDADATAWLLHPLRAGGSIALPPDREQPLLEGVSLAVCYAREAPFPEPLAGPARTDPVSVVHEVLHLFGATDKYGRSLDDFEPDSVTPREVMRLDETRLGRLRVDLRTAREIGWAGPETPTTAAGPAGRRRSSGDPDGYGDRPA